MKHLIACIVSLLALTPRSAVAQDAVSRAERRILIAFYQDLHGENWTINEGWLGPEGTECRWFGVRCACLVSSCTEAVVDGIELPDNNLRGQLPRKLTSLKWLVLLDLRHNRLRGPLLPELGSLRGLTLLDVSENQLEGPVPPGFGGLVRLEWLGLNDNRFTGTLPDLGALTKLLYLNASHNFLSGSLPTWFGKLPFLTLLGLSGNNFTGGIPADLFELRLLAGLGLSDNHLSGRLPENIGHAQNLGGIALGGNRLAGAVPVSIADLRFLSGIDFGWNALFSPNAEVDAFVNDRADAWPVTQTWAPEGVSAVASGPHSVHLEWSLPANYLDTALHAPGGYLVFLRPEGNEKYRLARKVRSKKTLATEILGLQPGVVYEVRLQTFSEPHELNRNVVRSEWTPAVTVATLRQ